MRIVKQNRFKNLGELHKEWTEAGVKASRAPHTDVSRNLATVVIRGVLPGLKRRRTGLLPSGPKSSFQMRASFVFHLETKVLESGGRVEKLIAQVSWSPVLSFHSLWWFGVLCHQLFKDADFIFQQDLAPAHTAKSTKSWLNDQQTHQTWTQIIYEVLSRGKWETRDQKIQMSRRPLSKKPGLHTTSAAPQTDHLHDRTNWGSN